MDGYAYETSVIFRANNQWLYGREPVLRRMPDGRLVCLIYSGGPREPDPDNVVLIVRSEDDGRNWSEPEVLFRHSARPTWGTEIFYAAGCAPMAFIHTYHPDCYFKELKAHISFTHDSGDHWTEPASLPGPFSNLSVRQGVVLHDGAWMWPVYWQETACNWDFEKGRIDNNSDRSMDAPFRSGVMISRDRGKSFHVHGRIVSDQYGLWEPNIVEVEPNHIIMLMRADFSGCLYRSDSHDGGITWSAAMPTDIPNPGSKITLLRSNEQIILIHNPNSKSRQPLSIWVSGDGMNTWCLKKDLCSPDIRLFYPHGFIDHKQEMLYLACDQMKIHYLMKIPLRDIIS